MNSERLALTPAIDEYIFTKDTQTLYYGDGVTPGGRSVLKDELSTFFSTSTVNASCINFSYDTDSQKIRLDVNTSKIDELITQLFNRLAIELSNKLSNELFDGVPEVVEQRIQDLKPILERNFSNLLDQKLDESLVDVYGRMADLKTRMDAGIFNKEIRINANATDNSSITLNSLTDGSTDAVRRLLFQSSRGTLTNRETTQPGDYLGGMIFLGYTGEDFKPAGGLAVRWDVDADITNLHPNGLLELIVFNESQIPKILSFDGNGVLTAPVVQTGIYNSAQVPNGSKGMIIFNNTTGKFQGHNGTGWVDLS
jgi:hypothetical protein